MSKAKGVVLFGRPGSGKSSLADTLAEAGSLTPIRTGELLRKAVREQSPLGEQVRAYLKQGELVPASFIAQALRDVLSRPSHHGLLFDGFPRTLGQVSLLDEFQAEFRFSIAAYLFIDVSRDLAETRMTGRRVCTHCGATYHVLNQPPATPEICDLDAHPLSRRPDDNPAVIAERQDVFDAQTAPVVEYYRTHEPARFHALNGDQPQAAVEAEALRLLNA